MGIAMAQAAYDLDFNLWAKEQALALREGRFGDLDLEHLTEEVEDLGGPDRRELKNRTTILMMHILKWQYQPSRRSGSWYDTISEQRESLEDLLADRPSLKSAVEEVTVDNYGRAVKLAMKQTHFKRDAFPPECPYSFEDLFTIEVLDPEAT